MIKHAIVGTGFGANVHLPAFQAVPGIDVVALCDNGSGSASAYGRKGVSPYSNWIKMLDIEKPDSLSVVAPPGVQCEIVREALRRNIHILCEKPLGMNSGEASAMELARAEADLVGFVGFQFRYEPGVARFKEMLSKRSIGDLHRLDVTWLTSGRADPKRQWTWQHDAIQGGGVINAFASHAFDLLMWLSGQGIDSAKSLSRVLISQRPDAEGRPRAVTAEDSFDAILELGKTINSSIRISNCIIQGTGFRLEAFGNEGSIRFEHLWPFTADQATLLIRDQKGERPVDLSSAAGDQNGDSRILPTSNLISDYCAVIGGEPLDSRMPTFADGVEVQKVIDMVR